MFQRVHLALDAMVCHLDKLYTRPQDTLCIRFLSVGYEAPLMQEIGMNSDSTHVKSYVHSCFQL